MKNNRTKKKYKKEKSQEKCKIMKQLPTQGNIVKVKSVLKNITFHPNIAVTGSRKTTIFSSHSLV